MFRVKNLNVSVARKTIIHNLSLSIKSREIHVLMGPNGSGKTSLAMALAGHPSYVIYNSEFGIHNSSIILDGTDITNFSPDKRARAGLFLSFQNPPAIEGISARQLLSPKIPPETIFPGLLDRPLNIGLSGGEKKKLELLQMLALRPKYIILDEIDSGLDLDSIRIVAKILNSLSLSKISKKPGLLIITHNLRLLKYLTPHYVHIIKAGKIIKSGGKELISKLEREGYAGFN